MMNNKDQSAATSPLREDEMNSGVAKVYMEENNRLRNEKNTLKKSLKSLQNKHEKLRREFHKVDKENVILHSKLYAKFLPEILKFAGSGLGIGLAVNFLTNSQYTLGIVSLIVAVFTHGGILFIYRNKI